LVSDLSRRQVRARQNCAAALFCIGGVFCIGLVFPDSALAVQLPAMALGTPGFTLQDALWYAITGGCAVAAVFAFKMLIRASEDDRLQSAEAQVTELRKALDRAEALLACDDQKTIVWDTPDSSPQVLGALPERIGAPFDRNEFLAIGRWLQPDSVAQLESAVQRIRRYGEGFQFAANSLNDSVLEVTGRTNGKRVVVRFRELTGERRSFAELKDQARFILGELTAHQALAETLPFPLWRRNKLGRLTWVNQAYVDAVEAENQAAVLKSGVELLGPKVRDAIRHSHSEDKNFHDSAPAVLAGERRRLNIFDILIEDGSIGTAIDVSEVDAIREEWNRGVESNARTLDQLTAAVAVFDKDQRLRFYNAAYRTMWDLSRHMLANMPEESAILDQLRADRKLPEQANYREWRSNHLAAYQAVETREDWWHLPDGRTLRFVATPNAEGGLTYIYENVTEQLSLESQVNSLSHLQGETLDHLSEGVAVFGTDGKLQLFNPVFAEIWRLSPSLLSEGPHVSEVIEHCSALHNDADTWENVRIAATDIEHSDTLSGRMERPDESVIDYATVALPEGMTMITFVDVSDSARMQRALSERNEALEAADRLKTDFIQHVSYELRSPLTSIIGFAEMVADETTGPLNAQQREYMDHISSSSSSLLAIINDILDLATVDAGIMELEITEVDVHGVALSAVEGLRDRLEEQNINFSANIPSDAGKFRADENRVRQILFNVVANAVRFSNTNGQIELSATKENNWVVYTVKDDGVGIPEDMLPAVLEPFEGRGGGGRRRGAGLGLSIVKSLVELHGGSVDMESTEGVGTQVVIRLPEIPHAAAIAAE
jgi:signal transduction histidine kinase